jgi:hypothetical protein
MSARQARNRPLFFIAALAISLAMALSGCQDFFGTVDLKQMIKEEVEEATATELTITIQADPLVPGGAPSPAGSFVAREGIPFSLSTSVFSAYAFKDWTANSSSGTVVFSSPANTSTTATIIKGAGDIVLQANYFERPTLPFSTPGNGESNQLKTTVIKLEFSQPMKAATINLSTVRVFERSPIATVWTDKTEDYFSDITQLSPIEFALNYQALKSLEPNYYYRVILSKLIEDANDVSLEKPITISFRTGIGSDTTNPVINNLYIGKTPSGTATAIASNSALVYLFVEATDTDDGGNIRTPASYKILDGATETLETYQGIWKAYTLASTDEGLHTLTVIAYDEGNLPSPSRQVSVNYDITAPGAPGTPVQQGGTAGYFNAGDTSLVLRVPLGSGSAAGDRLELLMGGALVKDSTLSAGQVTAGYFEFSLTAGELGTDGGKAFTARQTDAAGNQGDAGAALAIYKDTALPNVSISSIASNHSSYSAYARNGDQITLSFTATDANLSSTASVSIANIALAPVAVSSGLAASASYTLIPGNPIADGPTPYSVTVSDLAGNQNTVSAGAPTPVRIDRSGPAFTLTSFLSNNAVTNLAKAGNTVTLSFTLSEPAGGAGLSAPPSVAFTIGGSSVTGSVTQPSGSGPSYSATYQLQAGDPEGAMAYAVTGPDALGNPATGTVSGGGIDFDRTPPGAPGTPVQQGGTAGYFNAGDTSLVLRVPLGSGSAAGDRLELLMGGAFVKDSTLSAGQVTAGYFEFSLTAGELGTDGGKAFTARQTDAAGNQGDAGAALAIYKDTALPNVSISSIASNHSSYSAYARNGDQITLSFTATDANLSSTASVSIANIALAPVAVSSGLAASASYTLIPGNPIADGPTPYSVTVSDLAGNQNTVSAGAPTPVRIDRSGPAFTLTSFLSNNAVTNLAKAGNTVTLSFTLSEPAGGAGLSAPPSVAFTIGGSSVTGSVTQPSGSGPSYSATYQLQAGDPEGAMAYAVTGPDALGNPATGTVSGGGIDFDRTPPGAPGTPVQQGGTAGYFNAGDTSLVLRVPLGSGSAAGDRLELLMGGTLVKDSTLSAGQVTAGYFEFSLTAGELGTDGGKAFTARQTDAAGNQGDAGAALAIIKDLLSPAIHLVDPYKPRAVDNAGVPTLSIRLSASEISGLRTIYYWSGTGAKADATQVYAYTVDPSMLLTDADIVAILSSLTVAGSFRFSIADAAGNESDDGYSMLWTTEYAYGGASTRSLFIPAGTSKSVTPSSASVQEGLPPASAKTRTSTASALFIEPSAWKTVSAWPVGSIQNTGTADDGILAGAASSALALPGDRVKTIVNKAVESDWDSTIAALELKDQSSANQERIEQTEPKVSIGGAQPTELVYQTPNMNAPEDKSAEGIGSGPSKPAPRQPKREGSREPLPLAAILPQGQRDWHDEDDSDEA